VESKIPLYVIVLISLFCAGLLAGVIVLVILRGKLKKKEPELNTVYVEESPDLEDNAYL